VAGAATYEIQFDDSSSFTNPLFAAQTGLTQTQTTQTFTSERRFWWRVRARTAGQVNGTWSAARSIDIKRDAAPLPTSTRTPTAIGPSVTPTSNHRSFGDTNQHAGSHSDTNADCHPLADQHPNPNDSRGRYGLYPDCRI
jgi:hypothetical protein